MNCEEVIVVKANQGFYVIEPCFNDDGDAIHYLKEDVIAWAIKSTRSTVDKDISFTATPIIAGTTSIFRDYFILNPDGTVCEPDCDVWETTEHWLKDMEKRNY